MRQQAAMYEGTGDKPDLMGTLEKIWRGEETAWDAAPEGKKPTGRYWAQGQEQRSQVAKLLGVPTPGKKPSGVPSAESPGEGMLSPRAEWLIKKLPKYKTVDDWLGRGSYVTKWAQTLKPAEQQHLAWVAAQETQKLKRLTDRGVDVDSPAYWGKQFKPKKPKDIQKGGGGWLDTLLKYSPAAPPRWAAGEIGRIAKGGEVPPMAKQMIKETINPLTYTGMMARTARRTLPHDPDELFAQSLKNIKSLPDTRQWGKRAQESQAILQNPWAMGRRDVAADPLGTTLEGVGALASAVPLVAGAAAAPAGTGMLGRAGIMGKALYGLGPQAKIRAKPPTTPTPGAVPSWLMDDPAQAGLRGRRTIPIGQELPLPFRPTQHQTMPGAQAVVPPFRPPVAPGAAPPTAPVAPAAAVAPAPAPAVAQTRVPDDTLGQLVDVLRGMKGRWGQQGVLRRKALSQKMTQAEPLLTGQGEAGLTRAGRAMGGELPALPSAPAQRFSQSQIDEILDMATTHPDFDAFQRLGIADEMRQLLRTGRVPGPKMLKKMQRVYGPEMVDALVDPTRGELFKRRFIDIAGVPRTAQTIADVSAAGRQGKVLVAAHPARSGQALKRQLGVFFSKGKGEAAFNKTADDIMGLATTKSKLARRSGLDLSMAGGGKGTGVFGGREEPFASTLGERLPTAMRSERAYDTFLNWQRASIFDDWAKKQVGGMKRAGESVDDTLKRLAHDPPKKFRDMADWLNNATGRGRLPQSMQGLSEVLNVAAFSPRLQASRIRLMNPLYYKGLAKPVQKEAAKAVGAFGAANVAGLGLAKASGAEVEIDPRSSDFGKARIGNIRLDPWAGLQPYARLGAQLTTGQRKSRKGRVYPMMPPVSNMWEQLGLKASKKTTPMDPDLLDSLTTFVRGKASPALASTLDTLMGESTIGEPTTAEGLAYRNFTPMDIQDAVEAYRETGDLQQSGLLGILSALGEGVQIQSKEKQKNPMTHRELLRMLGLL